MSDQNRSGLPQLGLLPEHLKSFFLLEDKIREKKEVLDAWFEAQWEKTPPPVYGSVDLRNAGFKLVPVDMNLFPAGFNNLNPAFFSETAEAAKAAILSLVPHAKTLALIPEAFTRNLHYWENIWVLMALLKEAGFKVWLASPHAEGEPIDIHLADGRSLHCEPFLRVQDEVQIQGEAPDLILLNNDLSNGVLPILQEIKQPLLPPAALGWHQRLKSEHFQYYDTLSQEFAALLDLDPWLINPLFRPCGEIDFLRREGLDCLMMHTEALLTDIQKKYDHYGVSMKPFVVVKADAGTQGMAVMMVKTIEELKLLNRKQRTLMAKSKGGVPVRRVIVQEGVHTAETFGSSAHVAEPVVYLWGKQVVGGFYRIHEARGFDENLNSPGMHFNASPFAWHCASCPEHQSTHDYPQHLYTYGVIAKLSMLAAGREMKSLRK